MIAGIVLLVVGSFAPFVLRRVSGHSSPRLMVAANIAAMALLWLGIVDVISLWMMPDHGLLGLCHAAFAQPQELSDVQGMGLFTATAVMLVGRALWTVAATYRAVRRINHRLVSSERPAASDVAFADLGTVACTVGFLRPRIILNHARFMALSAAQQRAVLTHERSHASGLHPLIDLAARGLAAGLAPWPSARVAYEEIRRHLEAAADDCAARRTSPRDVATAIVHAALPPPVAALGASGWAAWRVDRLLHPRPRRIRHGLIALAVVGAATAAITQLSGHAIANLHMVQPLHCCTT